MADHSRDNGLKRWWVLIAILAAVALSFGTAARPDASQSLESSLSVSSSLSPPQ